jgi:signal peptidase II
MSSWLRWSATGGVIIATIGCDRATKEIAARSLSGRASHSFLADTIRLQLVENRGGFLGLGANLPELLRWGVFTLGTVLLLMLLAFLVTRHRPHSLVALGLALVWAGGMSNWIDRAMHGTVIDFLNVGIGSLRTGIFNVADMAIMAGVALVLFGSSRFARHGSRGNAEEGQPD